MKIRSAAALATVALAGAIPALAQQGVVSFSGGSLFATFQADGDTIGWTFRAINNIQVTSLGYWDGDAATLPMVANIPVGLWDAAGTLLASTVVTPATALTGAWRFESISAVQLTAGLEYRLGAFVASNNTTASGYMTGVSNLVVGPDITFLNVARDTDGAKTGLVFPTILTTGSGRFGPNFEYVIPAPASLAVVGMGLAMGLRRRR